ncbi:MAG: cupin domain-containing protein [Hyphomicrobiales bacterium]
MNKKTIRSHQNYNKDKFTKSTIFENKDCKTFLINLLPNQCVPEHQHKGKNLVIYVLTGKGKVSINNQKELIQEGDILNLQEDDLFSLSNCSTKNLSCLVTMFNVQ